MPFGQVVLKNSLAQDNLWRFNLYSRRRHDVICVGLPSYNPGHTSSGHFGSSFGLTQLRAAHIFCLPSLKNICIFKYTFEGTYAGCFESPAGVWPANVIRKQAGKTYSRRFYFVALATPPRRTFYFLFWWLVGSLCRPVFFRQTHTLVLF
jgi:hypothetical protein